MECFRAGEQGDHWQRVDENKDGWANHIIPKLYLEVPLADTY